MNFRSDRHVFFFVLLLFAVNKLLVMSAVVWATKHLIDNLSVAGYLKYIIIDNFYKWDSGWYGSIVEKGYTPKSSAFFPLYPMLIYAGHHLFSLSIPMAGALISNLAFLAMLYFAYKLLRVDYEQKDARKIMWLLCLFPTSYYFSAVYTESLFLLLMAITLYCIRTQNWTGALASGWFVSITRNTGVFLTVPYALETFKIKTWGDLFSFLRGSKTHWIQIRWKPFFLVFLMPLPFFAYMGYLWFKFQDSFAFMHSQDQFGRGSLNPFVTIYKGYETNLAYLLKTDHIEWYGIYYFVEVFVVSLALLVLVGTIRKLRLSYWIIILYSVLIPLSAPANGQVIDYFVSFIRYSLVIFPLFIGLYELIKGKKPLYLLTLGIFAVLLLALTFHWSVDQWVA
ncbi:hypothetical protein [Effusibacillus consociatus]|uniref:Glycosyltransferase RgtA/B/C/D-like domain-containing protein n=1 Tax=Effusibacillus consociatus TaxID=1117041 RepID=A0ABV9QBD0_9BACL